MFSMMDETSLELLTWNTCDFWQQKVSYCVIAKTEGQSGFCFCVEVLRPSQPNRVVLSAVSLPNHTFTGQV